MRSQRNDKLYNDAIELNQGVYKAKVNKSGDYLVSDGIVNNDAAVVISINNNTCNINDANNNYADFEQSDMIIVVYRTMDPSSAIHNVKNHAVDKVFKPDVKIKYLLLNIYDGAPSGSDAGIFEADKCVSSFRLTVNIKEYRREKYSVARSMLHYIYCIPLDIILFPIQLITYWPFEIFGYPAII